ncbi:hypothetical protein RHGRI_023794 [Rhododendron griersonianum]|uniref:Protein kinase domain-containing protein n=1 Tax=Rhododendron griersonianum TaxID=479676 RepID=A0AAV6J4Y9_9ERIC|nr:hypothetical protein RHGRI_023794 [Rhododendron griersonianum]
MLLNFDNSCPLPRHNFSTETTPFEYSPSYADLFFFYNCTENPTNFRTYPVSCASNSTHHSFAVFHIEFLKLHNYSIDSCQSLVNAPVESRDIRELLKMNFTDVLRKGFVLQWNQTYCNDCQRSGGSCRSVDNEFTCVCPDKPHSRTCDEGKRLSLTAKLGIGSGTAAGSLLVITGLVFFIHKASLIKNRKKPTHTSSMLQTDLEKGYAHSGIKTFTYDELVQATHNFDTKREIGDGGFCTVYQGKLQDGRAVAVKRLYDHNHKKEAQFMNEVEILTRLRHQNLVSLYGCTSLYCHELLLVYEYIPNGTVADHLYHERAIPGSLSWPTRMKIAIETASALSYLHASNVIHRDVKTTNILLDNNFCVKVADFGLSRFSPIDVTHISTAPQGTLGYVDPEYYESYQLTTKSDVYSFGVVLFELISSKPAVDINRNRHEVNLSTLAIAKIQSHTLDDLVDPELGFESDHQARKMITEVAELAFQCLQNARETRPSMEELLGALIGIQREDYDAKSAEELEIPAHEAVVMLKSDPPTFSPVSSLTENCSGRGRTPYSSS